MINTWLPDVVRQLGPGWKQGYVGFPRRKLSEILGEVDHSAGGGLQATFKELNRRFRKASWTFTIAKSGRKFQHYPLESITWHCGKRGDWNTPGNVTLVGIEHEGGAPGNESEPLTWEQEGASVKLSHDIRRLCSRVRANAPMPRVNLFEHNWLSATACPSGRINWNKKVEGILALEPGPGALSARRLIRMINTTRIYLRVNGHLIDLVDEGTFINCGFRWQDVVDLPANDPFWQLPVLLSKLGVEQ